MEDRSANRMSTGMSDVIFKCVIPYITDPRDRESVSLVCWRWYELDALTRKHITIAFCYTSTPKQLLRRFKHIESIKLKGKPRAAMFNLIPEDWGGYVTPWVEKFSGSFVCLKSLHFRRMIVRDSDLQVIAQSRGRTLQVLWVFYGWASTYYSFLQFFHGDEMHVDQVHVIHFSTSIALVVSLY